MSKNEHGLTPQQEKFAQGLGAGLNQSAAYREAYPASLTWADKTIWEKASVLAGNEKVKARLAIIQEMAAEKASVSAARILEEIQRVAYSDIRAITKPDGTLKLPHELDAATAAAVASFEIDQYGGVKYKFWDKNSSLEKLAKHKGLYELDNKQKTDPLRDLLQSLSGNVTGVSDIEGEDE
ncbi:terminase small subunit [Undibacterium sp. Rencai35W]|uniref:terminase small subunit n=1 Tax=Undibacterium sp. Rencai35W TaxID=3413046 RepID=UPI003BF298C6